jgi:hypothetical protein
MPSEDATNYSDKLRLQSRRLQHRQRLQAIVAFHRQPVMHPTRFKSASITYAVNIYYCDTHAVLTDQQIYSNSMLLTILISKHALLCATFVMLVLLNATKGRCIFPTSVAKRDPRT